MKAVLKATFASLILVYFLWSGVIGNPYGLDILAVALVFGLYAAGVDLAWGYGGILLLGSALFYGIGAYGMAFALQREWEPLLTYPSVIGVSVLLALVIAYIGFRARASQVHFGLIGLAISLGFERLAVTAYDITGGSNGLTGIGRPVLGGVVDLSDSRAYYFVVLAVVTAVIGALYYARSSAWGDAVRAVKTDELKAEALGYNVLAVKLQVVAVSAAVISLAGTLFPPVSGTAYPALFGIALNMQALVWVAIGGAGTLLGPFVLAAVLKILESYLSGVFIDYYLLVLGLTFVFVVVVLPQGFGGMVSEIVRRVSRFAQRGRKPADKPEVER